MRKVKHQYELTAIDKTKRAYLSAERNAKSASRRIASAFALASGAAGVGLLASQITRTGLEFERYERTLRAVTGSQAAAGREFEFVTREAQRLGLQIGTTLDQYAKLTAASKGTNLEGQQTRDIFSAVSEASAVLGLSADQTSGALTAIQQIISKGTVSAEELRGQLGERLPGAFQIAARSIGVTTAELDKLLRNGELTAEELLPKLAQELRNTFGSEVEDAANSTQAAINRFKTELELTGAALAEELNPQLEKTLGLFSNLIKASREGGSGLSGEAAEAARNIEALTRELNILERNVSRRSSIFSGSEEANQRDLARIAEINRLLQEQKNIQLQAISGGDDNLQIAIDDTNAFEAELREADQAAEQLANRMRGISEISVNRSLRDNSGFDAIQDFVQQAEVSITPVERLNNEVRRLNELRTAAIAAGIEESRVNEVINRSLQQTAEAYNQNFVELEKRNTQIQFIFSNGIFSAFDDGVDGMVKAWARGLQQMLARAAAANLFEALGFSSSGNAVQKGATNGFAGFFKSLFGFKDGGEFMVGGGGGVDSQLVAFRATPNEKVTVTKPGQSAGGGFQFSQTVNIDARGADEARIMRVLPTLLERNKEQTKAEIQQMRQRGRF